MTLIWKQRKPQTNSLKCSIEAILLLRSVKVFFLGCDVVGGEEASLR